MKKHLILILSIAALAAASYAGTTLLVGTPATVNNTTLNGSTITNGVVTAPKGNFIVSNGGLTATTALVMREQVSLDGTNWVNTKTNSFSGTNATTTIFAGGNYAPITVYTRMVFITTNSVDITASYAQ